MPEQFSIPPYPLEQVLFVKKKRVDDASRVVREKLQALEVEQDKLHKREEERDKVKHHYGDKLIQLRHEYDGETTSAKIDQMKKYIKVVQERLKGEEKKVKDQQQQVDVAEKNLELARSQLRARRKEQDKLDTHKVEWTKETAKELIVQEEKEQDDVGSTMFLSKFMQQKK